MSRKIRDITGMRFGRLVAIEPTNRRCCGRVYWLCRCDCGNVCETLSGNLLGGNTRSCGCIQREGGRRKPPKPLTLNQKRIRMRRQKLSEHKDDPIWQLPTNEDRLYAIWDSMRSRCKKPTDKSYYLYGARGISVCQEWDDYYVMFKEWALSNGYNYSAPYGQCTLDRIDVDGNYEPSNCRWVDSKTQQSNRRCSKKH